MTISEEDVAEFVMVCRSRASCSTIKKNTGIRTSRVGVHTRKIVVCKTHRIQTTSCITFVSNVVYKRRACNFGTVGRRFQRSGRANVHLHIGKDAVENQRLKSLGGRMTICTICRSGCFSANRQNDIIREVGVKLESETDLLLIGRAGDSAGFFTGRVQRGEEHAGEDCDNRNYHNQWYIIITNKTFTENLL